MFYIFVVVKWAFRRPFSLYQEMDRAALLLCCSLRYNCINQSVMSTPRHKKPGINKFLGSVSTRPAWTHKSNWEEGAQSGQALAVCSDRKTGKNINLNQC